MAIQSERKDTPLQNPFNLVGTKLTFLPFHADKLIATTSDLTGSGIEGVVIRNVGTQTYVPSARIFAVIADLTNEKMTFWFKGQDASEPLRPATYSTQKASIYFQQQTPPQRGTKKQAA